MCYAYESERMMATIKCMIVHHRDVVTSSRGEKKQDKQMCERIIHTRQHTARIFVDNIKCKITLISRYFIIYYKYDKYLYGKFTIYMKKLFIYYNSHYIF